MCRIIILNATKSKDYFPAVYCNISSATHNQSKKETAVKSYGLPTSAIQVAKASNNLKKYIYIYICIILHNYSSSMKRFRSRITQSSAQIAGDRNFKFKWNNPRLSYVYCAPSLFTNLKLSELKGQHIALLPKDHLTLLVKNPTLKHAVPS